MALRRRKNFKEEDLYEPMHKWLINQNYEVQAEVKSCDIVALKDDTITIIELKKSFNLQLVYQCIKRQKIGQYVYAAFATPKKTRRNKNIENAKMLARQLGIGIILIHLYTKSSVVELCVEAKLSTKRKNHRKKKAMLNEFSKRTGDYNVGGKKGKIITSYREAAIKVYYLLQQLTEASPAELKKLGAPANTGNILRDNHYGWFHKIKRGRYTYDTDLEEMRSNYPEIIRDLENS